MSNAVVMIENVLIFHDIVSCQESVMLTSAANDVFLTCNCHISVCRIREVKNSTCKVVLLCNVKV